MKKMKLTVTCNCKSTFIFGPKESRKLAICLSRLLCQPFSFVFFCILTLKQKYIIRYCNSATFELNVNCKHTRYLFAIK